VKTVFTLAESIDSKETATVFIVLIGATMVLEILIEGLNEVHKNKPGTACTIQSK